MSENKEKKQNNENDEYSLSLEDAKSILDRIIGFVNNCDSKVSIILGIYGIIMAVLFSDGGIKSMKEIIKISILKGNYIYLLFFMVSVGILGSGFLNLILALIAKIDCEKYKDNTTKKNSEIFWGDIAKFNNYEDYLNKINILTNKEYLNDLMTQVYLNSKICTEKFKRYNRGSIISTIGFALFIIWWFIGLIIY